MKNISTFFIVTKPLQYLKIPLTMFFAFLSSVALGQVANYTFSQSSGVYGEISGGSVTTATGSGYNDAGLDDVIKSYIIPFGFNYDGTDYTTVSISSNGFMTFGTAPAINNYVPISSNANYTGAISAWGKNLNGFYNIGGRTSEMTVGILGSSAPNRIVVFQWKNFRPTDSNSTTQVPYKNFQIRLYETTNKIEIIYGNSGYAAGSTSVASTVQVGLRGPNNTFATNVNNRKNIGTVNFGSSSVGTANDSSQAFNTTATPPGLPSSGLTYTWTPPVCSQPSAQPTALNLTPAVTSIAGSFTASASASGYLVVRTNTLSPPTNPVSGTVYTAGSNALGGVIIKSSNTTTFTDTPLLGSTQYWYWIFAYKSGCTGQPAYRTASPLSGSSTTLSPSYCTPTSAGPQWVYIDDVKFMGTLNDVSNLFSGYSGGYQDWTARPKAIQAQGGGINIYYYNNSYTGGARVKAWVDWNKNGIFESGELVYDTKNTEVTSATFGLIIPVTTLPGDYRIRIRNNIALNWRGVVYVYNFNDCEDFDYTFSRDLDGEAEDYLFTVVPSYDANVIKVTDGENCGTGTVNLNVTGSATATGFNWYSSETGPSFIAYTASGTWTTPSISATTDYWVTATNGVGESLKRTKVVAKVKQLPVVTFNPIVPAVCGIDDILELSAGAGTEVVNLINEDFEGGGLGVFYNNNDTPNGSPYDAITVWQNKENTYRPTNTIVWSPAISSGINESHFVMSTSDVNPPGPVHQFLELSSAVNATKMTGLNLTFDMYYSNFGDQVTIQANSGLGWTNVQTFSASVGIGTRFANQSIDLSAFNNSATLKIRFQFLSNWGDGVAIDNVLLSGTRPLTPSFEWSSSNPIEFYSNPEATTHYVEGDPAEVVYIKPTSDQTEDFSSWEIEAKATLTNGCSAIGNVVINNNSKIWNTANTNWTTTNWKPNTAVPTDTKCVVVKTPVTLGVGAAGVAKNLIVQGTGHLTIAGDLTVTDFVKNTTGIADRITVKSDANLIQKNSTAPNSGSIRAERTATNLVYNPAGSRADYVYWGSPVTGQQTFGPGGFSPGTPADRFYYYLESNDKFYPTGNTEFIPGRGYAVQAERDKGTGPYTKDYVFTGTPNNGDISFNITRSADTVIGGITYVHGYNLVSNPYPSNIKFNELYLGNCVGVNCLIWNNAYFWTNASYTQYQQGSAYGGNNYAAYNGTGGNPATTPTGQLNYPNGIVKVGQGFLVQKKDSGTAALVFKNSYGASHDLRVSTAGTFFQRDAVQKNRYWLSLLAPSTLINTQLIGYIEGATNDYEQDYDAEAFDLSSDLFYSIIPTKNLLIQGRSEVFTDEDKVIIGANFFQNGSYTIALENAEGIFNTTQNIYLKDKEEGTITNLSQGSYTFTATKGNNTGRFEIIYKPEIVLVTDTKIKEGIVVYRDSDNFVIQSPKVITRVEVYDASGKLITVLKPNKKQGVLDASTITNGIYVLKITTSDGVVTNKKISR